MAAINATRVPRPICLASQRPSGAVPWPKSNSQFFAISCHGKCAQNLRLRHRTHRNRSPKTLWSPYVLEQKTQKLSLYKAPRYSSWNIFTKISLNFLGIWYFGHNSKTFRANDFPLPLQLMEDEMKIKNNSFFAYLLNCFRVSSSHILLTSSTQPFLNFFLSSKQIWNTLLDASARTAIPIYISLYIYI